MYRAQIFVMDMLGKTRVIFPGIRLVDYYLMFFVGYHIFFFHCGSINFSKYDFSHVSTKIPRSLTREVELIRQLGLPRKYSVSNLNSYFQNCQNVDFDEL